MSRLATEQIIGAIVLCFGLAAAALSMNVGSQMWGGESARLFPLAVSIVLVLLGGALMLKGVESYSLGEEARSVLGLLVLGLAYVWLISKFGYLVATGVTAPLVFWVFGTRWIPGLLLSAILCPLVFHLIFFVGLGVFPPYGEWFDLLDVIQGQ